MLWKILLLALAGYILYRLFMNDKGKKKETEKQEKETLIANGELVKDPVCGTYVDPESSITARDGDKRYHFCSYECRDTFIKKVEAAQQKEVE